MEGKLRLVGLVAAAASVVLSAVTLFDVNPVMGLSAVFGAAIPAAFIYWFLLEETTA